MDTSHAEDCQHFASSPPQIVHTFNIFRQGIKNAKRTPSFSLFSFRRESWRVGADRDGAVQQNVPEDLGSSLDSMFWDSSTKVAFVQMFSPHFITSTK